MRSRLIILLLFLSFNVYKIMAQTVIKIPFNQPDKFAVQPRVVNKSMEENERIVIGSDTEVTGGSGKYSYTWYKGNVVIGSDPTLTITEKGEYILTINDGVSCEASTSYLIDTILTGINNMDKTDIHIYPNPASGIFYIQYPVSQNLHKVEIYNMDGKLLNSYPVDQTYQNELRIDASVLPSGQYLLVSHFEMKKITRLLVVK